LLGLGLVTYIVVFVLVVVLVVLLEAAEDCLRTGVVVDLVEVAFVLVPPLEVVVFVVEVAVDGCIVVFDVLVVVLLWLACWVEVGVWAMATEPTRLSKQIS